MLRCNTYDHASQSEMGESEPLLPRDNESSAENAMAENQSRSTNNSQGTWKYISQKEVEDLVSKIPKEDDKSMVRKTFKQIDSLLHDSEIRMTTLPWIFLNSAYTKSKLQSTAKEATEQLHRLSNRLDAHIENLTKKLKDGDTPQLTPVKEALDVAAQFEEELSKIMKNHDALNNQSFKESMSWLKLIVRFLRIAAYGAYAFAIRKWRFMLSLFAQWDVYGMVTLVLALVMWSYEPSVDAAVRLIDKSAWFSIFYGIWVSLQYI